VKRRIRSGSLPAFRDGRLMRVREDDLRRFIVERVARTGVGMSTVAAGVTLPPGSRLWD